MDALACLDPERERKAEKPPHFAAQIAVLYRQKKNHLHDLFTRRLGNRCAAEDLVQEAFAHYLASYCTKAIENPLGLLYRIAINIIRDDERARRLRIDRLSGVPVPLWSEGTPDPEHAAATRQRLGRLQEAIDDLPPRCREVFLLHKVEGLSHDQVSRLLGVSVAAVEKHMVRAHSRLRSRIGELYREGDGD